MKNRAVQIVLALLLLAGTSVYNSGCKNATPVTVAYRGEGTLVASVNTAMMGWADWVRQGRATQPQVDAVRNAYGQYYNSQMIAKAAVDAYAIQGTPESAERMLQNAAAVSSAGASLVALIESFRSQPEMPPLPGGGP